MPTFPSTRPAAAEAATAAEEKEGVEELRPRNTNSGTLREGQRYVGLVYSKLYATFFLHTSAVVVGVAGAGANL